MVTSFEPSNKTIEIITFDVGNSNPGDLQSQKTFVKSTQKVTKAEVKVSGTKGRTI